MGINSGFKGLTADYYLNLLQYELPHIVEDVQLQTRYSIMYAEVLTQCS